MTGARYIIRIDDVTPTMNWGRFWAALSLLLKHKARPLLGVVPDNQDPKLDLSGERQDFWTVMRQLSNEQLVDIAQHGYQHTLRPRPGLQMIGHRFGIKEMSEFAGDSYASQVRRLDAGRCILEAQGLPTGYFMPPNHSFDLNTLRALKTCGFSALSDGIALFPFRRAGITCVPQQLWKPAWLPCGVMTICLHTNEMDAHDVKLIRSFLRSRPQLTSFSREAQQAPGTLAHRAANASFNLAYSGARAAQLATRSLRGNYSPGL